jgi:trimeric autotransporter adhesin
MKSVYWNGGSLITSFAGTGTAGYSGDGGLASNAQINGPHGLVVDASSSNLYFSDASNHIIRSISLVTGIISLFAGVPSSTGSFSGDGGVPTNAHLNSPQGLAFDQSGILYISDSSNCCVRKVSGSVITTYAGVGGSCAYAGDNGPATSASLNSPAGLVFDSAGNLFVSNPSHYIVRKVSRSTSTITLFAGTPGQSGFTGDGGPATSAKLSLIHGLAYFAGTVYLSAYENNAIRAVVVATGMISTYAGSPTGVAGFTDGPLATALLKYPYYVTPDQYGNLYMGDWQGYSVIRKVSRATGSTSTIAGNRVTGYSGDGGLALAAEFNGPLGVAFDSKGNMYVSDHGE